MTVPQGSKASGSVGQILSRSSGEEDGKVYRGGKVRFWGKKTVETGNPKSIFMNMLGGGGDTDSFFLAAF